MLRSAAKWAPERLKAMKPQKLPDDKGARFRVDRLAELMRQRNLTQLDLAKYLGVAPSQVSRWLSGANSPTADTVAILADYFQVSIDWLMNRVSDNVPYYQMPELSPKEWELVLAIRDGSLVEAIELILKDLKNANKPKGEGS